MNQELKTKWVEALRSGRYLQGTSNLCRHGKYCCLGVLCEVAGRDDDWRDWNIKPFLGDGSYGIHEKQAEELADMNDSGKTFPEIADWIEKEIPADVPA